MTGQTSRVWWAAAALTAVLATGCEQDDPVATPDAAVADAAPEPDADLSCADAGVTTAPIDESSCAALANDYAPRAAAADTWPACVSDTDPAVYVFSSANNTSSIARVTQFEQIGALLWNGVSAPGAQAFTDAEFIYIADQGLSSRLERREDEHYPRLGDAVNGFKNCTDVGVDLQANRDRCVGPAVLLPIIDDAFARGKGGEGEPRVHAARIEAAVLYFLYVSSYKEGVTCQQDNKPADCDSSWAYYAGGDDRGEAGQGLSARVKAVSAATHDRIYDGALAVRCWLDLKEKLDPGEAALHGLAMAQYDRALLRGVALVVRERALRMVANVCDPARLAADWAFIQVLAPALDREATARDATAAATLRAQLAKTAPADVDPAALVATLDALFPCP